MRHQRGFLIAAVAVAAAAAACGSSDIPLGPGWTDGFGSGGPGSGPIVYPLTLSEIHNLVADDTQRVITWASSGDARSTWVLSGPAVFVLRGDSVSVRIATPTAEVFVRGVGTGAVTIKAVRAGGVDSATHTFLVAQPSELTLRIVQGRDIRMPPQSQQWIVAHLLDSAGRSYRGPLTWISSDTSVVTLEDGVNVNPYGKFARARARGLANVIVAYRQQRDTARVEVQ